MGSASPGGDRLVRTGITTYNRRWLTATRSARRHGEGHTLDRHPRTRSQREADRDLVEAGRGIARLDPVARPRRGRASSQNDV